MTGNDGKAALEVLRQRGASDQLVAKAMAAGLPPPTLLRAIEAGGWTCRLRRWLRPQAPLSGEERRRLEGIAELAAAVAELEPDEAGVARFWRTPMPWLGGRTPIDTLASRDGPAAVADLANRLRHGIYS